MELLRLCDCFYKGFFVLNNFLASLWLEYSQLSLRLFPQKKTQNPCKFLSHYISKSNYLMQKYKCPTINKTLAHINNNPFKDWLNLSPDPRDRRTDHPRSPSVQAIFPKPTPPTQRSSQTALSDNPVNSQEGPDPDRRSLVSADPFFRIFHCGGMSKITCRKRVWGWPARPVRIRKFRPEFGDFADAVIEF